MRFAWLRQTTSDNGPAQAGFLNQLTLSAYNIIWWIPIVLTLIGVIDYSTGFIAFALVTAARLVANLYRVNVLTLAQAERFPFRSP